jgi:hypothetical protein
VEYKNILFSIEAGIALLTLNRPDKLNSFTGEMHAELRDALDRVQADKAARVLVLSGAGRAFCAGQDLADPDMAALGGKMPDIGNVVEKNYKPLVLRLQNLRVPTIAAVNGIVDEKEYLLQIGAKNVVSIDEATDTSGRPLLKGLWAGAIDTLGGPILATTLKSMLYGATVTCCGNAGSPDLPTNVYPFILRGVTLIGIDSQNCPMPTRLKVWQKIAGDWKLDNLEQLTTEIPLEGLNDRIQMVLDRTHRGRTVVRLPD